MLFSLDPASIAAATISNILFLKRTKISFDEALHMLLAYMLANHMPAKGIQLEVAIWDSQVDVKKVKQPQEISIIF